MKFESFEKNLYIPRDAKGEQNREEIELIRDLEEQLKENPSFVGIAPFGSTMEGYNTKESDIDLCVLCDGPVMESDVCDDKQAQKREQLFELFEQIKDWKQKMAEKDVSVLTRNINISASIHDLRRGVERGNPGEFVASTLADMTRVVTGKKIANYRSAVKKEIDAFEEEKKETIFGQIVESLIRREDLSISKRKERMPELSEQDHERIMEVRKKMWQKRVEKIWG